MEARMLSTSLFKRMALRLSVFASVLMLSNAVMAGNYGKYHIPEGPHPVMTPGSLCTSSSTYRYSEKIKYCDRDVSSGLKKRIIEDYDDDLGYTIEEMPRADFKIDHFIPLSIGGSNEATNLWPQHKSIYEHSDPLETEVFNLISEGKITQAEAIRVIKECKLNLGRCQELGDYLKSLH